MLNKETINCWLAVVLAISGAVLCYISFYVSEKHIIDEKVLWYMAQVLLYAASTFGLKSYIDFLLKKRDKQKPIPPFFISSVFAPTVFSSAVGDFLIWQIGRLVDTYTFLIIRFFRLLDSYTFFFSYTFYIKKVDLSDIIRTFAVFTICNCIDL